MIEKPLRLEEIFLVITLSLVLVAGCSSIQPKTINDISITVIVDGHTQVLKIPAGTTVQQALDTAGIKMNTLDQVKPPSYTVLSDKDAIRVIRVKEVFQVEENIIPFERQTVRNESLPAGQEMLIQPGVNGVQQVTYRQVLEDGVETSRSVFKTTTITEARPEIVMVGVQTPYTPVSLTGRLVYLTAGNAWVMENSTSERRPLVTTGDLDGRIFSLSPNGKWLLYSRKSNDDKEKAINTLWAVDITKDPLEPVNLRIKNVIHFANWRPGNSLTVAYSTVEPRDTAPGWQANNDLQLLTINEKGMKLKAEEIITANSGGIYGWWGTDYAWSPDGDKIAYARPDSIGLVDLEEKQLIPLIDLIPLQTRSDWAWVPGLNWSPDQRLLFTVTHIATGGSTSDETSPLFDLTALPIETGQNIHLAPQAGMFAYPVPSPILAYDRYLIAYLQAIFPEQSETSRYHLALIDRDGSNRTLVFPSEGSPGLEPQQVVWGPVSNPGSPIWLALMYQGNLWLYNITTDQSHQITGDGSIGKVDWQ